MKHWLRLLARAGICIFLLVFLGGWSPSTVAAQGQRSAVASAISGSMTLKITNGTTFVYDGPGPRFHLVLTLSAPISGTNTSFTAQIQADNGQQLVAYFSGPAADGVTYTADASVFTWDIGTRTATATITDPVVSPSITSNKVSFTITQILTTLSCDLPMLLLPGQAEQVPLHVDGLDGLVPLDWTTVTASVWLVGPKTVTYANLVPTSAGVVSITTPMQTGRYSLNCSYSGTAYYAPAQATSVNKDRLISEMRPLGGIQLYTTPQTMVANQTTQMLVVFKAAPGLPTPTGSFNITMPGPRGVIFTPSTSIGPNGTASLTLDPIPNLYGATGITVHYFGDPTYNDQSVNFPMTNPPVPGGGSGGGGAPHSQATPTANATATADATPGASAGATSTPPTAMQRAGDFPQIWTSGGLLALLITILLLLVLSSATVYVLWRRRRQALRSGAPAQTRACLPETVSTTPVLRQEPSASHWPLEQAPPQQ